jgi:hypothetical protein
MPSLSFQRTSHSGRALWGPHQVEGAVLVATLDSLVKLGGGPTPLWTRPLLHGLPVAPPTEVQGSYLFASAGGVVWSISSESGDESARSMLGESLAAGPTIIGSRLLVGGSDGVLHFLSLEP